MTHESRPNIHTRLSSYFRDPDGNFIRWSDLSKQDFKSGVTSNLFPNTELAQGQKQLVTTKL
jgi:hypothetical protein